jgi:Tol biopolymer transport system component
VLAKLAADDPPDEPRFEAGAEFSHYRIISRIGRGGMGEVYLADDLSLGRQVAIKVIHGDSGFGDQAAARLLREARAAARLDHPNICQVHEVGDTGGDPFIAMQYVEGETLDTLIGSGEVTYDNAIAYTRQIAAALGAAHALGIVHRDIKPSNVIIDTAGHARVLDFGLAKETGINSADAGLSVVGLIAGTVTYMSPEHIRGQEIDGRTDVWSLGVVLYQMLTGRLPFREATRADLAAAILHDEILDPGDVPPAVRYILGRALAKDLSDRYASVGEFDADLAELEQTGSLRTAVAASAAAKRNRLVRYAFAALLLLSIAGGSFGLWRYLIAQVPPGPAWPIAAGGLQTSTVYDLKRQVNGVINGLSFSPDGSMIAFALGEDNSRHFIYVQRLDGSEPVRLTREDIADRPVWSPDGQRIAYISSIDGKPTILAVPYIGGDPARLAVLEGPYSKSTLRKWSNDGKRMFLDNPNGPAQIDLETGNISPLDTSGVVGDSYQRFAVSPDETRMLVISSANEKERIWLRSIGRNDARVVSESLTTNGSPAWFSDGRRFAYSADAGENFQVYVGSIDGAPPQQVTFGSSNSSEPAVSPAGDSIAYLSDHNEANLFSLDIGSGRETVVTSKTTMQILPAISPDGRQIAYQTITDASRLFSGSLKIGPPDPGGTSSAIQFGSPGCCVRWSPDGTDITYIRGNGVDLTIWKYSPVNKSETQITSGTVGMVGYGVAPVELAGSWWDISTDGSKLVFMSRRSGQENIWTAASDGSGETAVTAYSDGMTKPYDPRWSPDGESVAFTEAIGRGYILAIEDNRIAVYRNGVEATVGRFEASVALLDWSADGKGVYVAVGGDKYFDIYIVPADGSGPRRIVTLPGARNSSIKISPDRKWVGYTERRDNLDNLYVAPLTGGKPRRVTANADTMLFYSGTTWSPDSRTLYYSKQTGGLQIGMVANKTKENR